MVEDEGGGDGATGDVEAALLSGHEGLARLSWAIETFLALLPDSGLVAVGGGRGAYAEAFVHGLVGGMGAPAALGTQQLPRRKSRSSGSEHCVEGSNW